MKQTEQRGRRLFELPPGSEQHLIWYGFLKRLPTTTFWLSLGYVAGFAALTILLGMIHTAPSGIWLGLYVLGGMLFGLPCICCLQVGSKCPSCLMVSTPSYVKLQESLLPVAAEQVRHCFCWRSLCTSAGVSFR